MCEAIDRALPVEHGRRDEDAPPSREPLDPRRVPLEPDEDAELPELPFTD